MTTPWLTVEESIIYLRRDNIKTAREQVLRLFRRGKVKAVKDGIRYLTTEAWLKDYLTRRES